MHHDDGGSDDDIAAQLIGLPPVVSSLVSLCSSVDDIVRRHAADALANMCEVPDRGIALLDMGLLLGLQSIVEHGCDPACVIHMSKASAAHARRSAVLALCVLHGVLGFAGGGLDSAHS